MVNRIDLEKQYTSPSFVGSWEIEKNICDDLVLYFENNQRKHNQGITSTGLNLKDKNRVDIAFLPKDINLPGNEIFKIYFERVFECYKDYNLQWPFLASMISRLEIGTFNLGRYKPGQHFQSIHCERSGINNLQRLLAFMTYLNDVEEGGSTYFNHYDLEIKPKKGLTLIWPAEWTHAHRGNIINKGCKYIITGWLNFPT